LRELIRTKNVKWVGGKGDAPEYGGGMVTKAHCWCVGTTRWENGQWRPAAGSREAGEQFGLARWRAVQMQEDRSSFFKTGSKNPICSGMMRAGGADQCDGDREQQAVRICAMEIASGRRCGSVRCRSRGSVRWRSPAAGGGA